MTRYDPFAHGQVKFDSAKTAPPRDAEDMLFAGADSVKQPPPADGSWELLKEDVSSLLPNAVAPSDTETFGADILGEGRPVPAQAATAQRRPEPAAPRPKLPKAAQEKKQAPPSPRAAAAAAPRVGVRTPSPVEATAASEPIQPSAVVPMVQKQNAMPRRTRAGWHAPVVLFVAGGAGAAWFGWVQHNYVLAAIVGCLTLVGMAFARLWLRD